MARGLLVLAAIALIALAWFAFSKTDRIAPAIAPKESSNASASTATLDAPKVDAARAAGKDADSSATPAIAATTSTAEVTIVGQLLHVDRSPATGARITLAFDRVNEDLEALATTAGPVATSDAEGRFRVSFAAQPDRLVRLEVVLATYATARWRWKGLAPGELVDVGEVVLRSAGTVEVRVLDATGRELSSGWTVNVSTLGAGNLAPFARQPPCRLDALHATARFEGLAAGTVEIEANHDASGDATATVELRAGETSRVDLHYVGPDPARMIGIFGRAKPLWPWSTALSEIVLIDPAGHEQIVAPRFEKSGTFLAQDLGPGPYAVEVRDPRFIPSREDGVMPGSRVDIALAGNSAIVLATSAQDAPTDLTVNLEWMEFANYSARAMDVVSKTRPLPKDGIVDGLLAGDIQLRARARGRVPIEMKIEKLAPNEVRTIMLEFAHGGRIAGRVVRADHVGLRDVDVRAALRKEDRTPEDNGLGELFNADVWAPSTMHARTDEDGNFEFAGLAQGEWTVRAIVAPAVHVLRDIQVSTTTDISDLQLVAPALGTLKGRVIGPEGLPLAQLSIRAMPNLQGEAKRLFDSLGSYDGPRLTGGPVQADGTFRCPPVNAGEVDVMLCLPRVHRTFGLGRSGDDPGPVLSLGRVSIPPGGEVSREYDLRGVIPPRPVVRVTVDGVVVPGVAVAAQARDAERVAAGGDVGDDGSTTLSWLPVGTYDIFVFAPERSWAVVAPTPLSVNVGGPTVLDVRVTLIDGDIELLAADAKPLADGTSISITHTTRLSNEASGGMIAQVKAGRIHVKMPAGHYLLDLNQSDTAPERSASIDWPGTTRVVLARDE